MKIARIQGRAFLVTEEGGCDIEKVSGGLFPTKVEELLLRLDELSQWLVGKSLSLDEALSTVALSDNLTLLEAPILEAQQIFAIGINYLAHSAESGLAPPTEPMVFTKFASSLAGPGDEIPLPNRFVDWEVELVAVVGKGGRNIAEGSAMQHIAGYCVGQDVSDRKLQFVSSPAQFNLGKSHQAFSPIGPWLTSADELDTGRLAISCSNQFETLQNGNTSEMIFSLPKLITYLSNVCELRTGDLIFTGTPGGVGGARKPPKFIEAGWRLISEVEGLGRLENPCHYV